MLYDQDFLVNLTKDRNKTIYAKIIALTFDELPIEAIEGRVTGGSINLDGSSAVRRTCSLTMVAESFDYSNYLWGLNTKFKLEIGVKNNVDSSYPDIIWFKQGLYLITSFNTSSSTSGFTINISGKDKMCLLNGEVGGTITAPVDWGKMEEIAADGTITETEIPLRTIIRNAVSMFGNEQLHNIIINDLPEYGYELLEYRYDTPMYLYRKYLYGKEDKDSHTFENVVIENDNKDYSLADEGQYDKTLADLDDYLETLVDPAYGSRDPKPIYAQGGKNNPYVFAKVSYGQTAGYHRTELVYCGDLTSAAGDSVVTVLDKITAMLSEFEYFYDLDGRFVFQQKASSIKSLNWSQNEDGSWVCDSQVSTLNSKNDKYSYMFNNGELITAFNNTPNLSNLKNDYSIWGEREGVSDTLAIHLRYAIDKKPTTYTSPYQTVSKEDPTLKSWSTTGENACDWRELIYQMAQDYMGHNQDDNYNIKLHAANPQFIGGRTGYEQYYTDILGFWRQMYAPTQEEQEKVNKSLSDLSQITYDEETGWNVAVSKAPDQLNFWMDFLDSEDSVLSQYSVRKIGARTKVVNETTVKGIYYRETPNVLYTAYGEKVDSATTTGYTVIQTGSDIDSMFSLSTQGKSAIDRLDELLYNHSYCIDSVNITAIPIYFLEPNTRIYIHDDKTKLNGDYIVSRVSLPLTYNGTMTITATKAAEDLI